MDRVTEGFLTQFAEERELTAMPQDRQFEHFVSAVTIRRHYNGETFDTSDILVRGGGDLGIDAIAILVNGSIVTDIESLQEHADVSGHFDVTFIFVQGDRGASFDGKKLSDFGFGVKDFFDPNPRLRRNVEIDNAAEIMEALYKGGTKFRQATRRVVSTSQLRAYGREMRTWRHGGKPWKTTCVRFASFAMWSFGVSALTRFSSFIDSLRTR